MEENDVRNVSRGVEWQKTIERTHLGHKIGIREEYKFEYSDTVEGYGGGESFGQTKQVENDVGIVRTKTEVGT